MGPSFGFVAVACVGFSEAKDGQTNIAMMLNSRIKQSAGGTYKGGDNKGLIVRTPDFFSGGDDTQVVPATLWHNDLFAPSGLYPTVSNVFCPCDGWDGFYNQQQCSEGPWEYAIVGAVCAGSMSEMFQDFEHIQDESWNNGVFFPSDANAAESRCIWRQEWNGWDCPGGWISMDDGGFQPDQEHKGSGTYAPGNPDVFGFDNAGGGTGCHFDPNYNAIDQQDAYDTKGNLVQDANCQCNYAYKGDWKSWVWAWINNAQNKDEFPERNWLAGGSKAPSWAMDSASCWMNNPRDMIELQNEIFWASPSWNNRAAPKMDETSSRPEELRKYWGWNEVPVARWIVDDVNQWDAVIVKLPAAICDQHNDLGVTDSPSCLGSQAQLQLEKDLDNFVQQGKLVPGLEHIGDRPGSYVLFVREYGEQYSSNGAQGVNWQRFFFCESWVSPNKKYQIVYRDMESDPQGNGGCFIDYGGTPSPPPSPPSPPSPSPGPAPGPGPSPAPAPKGSIQHLATRKCLTLQDGHLKSGQSLFAQECTGDRSQKWKLHDGALVYTGQAKGQDYCVDAWSMQSGNSLQIWECNGLDQQQWGYDAKMKTFFLSTSGDASLCMDLANGDTVVQVWDCIMNDNQLWTYQIMEDDVVI